MSSAKAGPARVGLSRRRLVRGLSVLLATTSVLSACGPGGFQPLYGPSVSGIGVQQKLAQVDFAPIPGRVGQRIRNELVFQRDAGENNPSENNPGATHRLEVVIRESLISTLVDPTGLAGGQVYSVEASFRLTNIKDKKIVLQGTSNARAGFERFNSIYSNVRAREDAENRVARILGEDIKTRLATYLSSAV
jgi:LPS-assembly lipoprotein